ncbi:hypothetical protein [Psychroflexus sp. MBR-150]
MIFTILLFSNCKKDDDNSSDCGCNSPTIFTILESDEQKAFLYKNTSNSNENIPSHNYGIYFSEPNCTNCVHTFFVCNDDLTNSIEEIPNYPGIEVQFSGQAKKICQDVWAPGDYTYNYITLTSIEQL